MAEPKRWRELVCMLDEDPAYPTDMVHSLALIRVLIAAGWELVTKEPTTDGLRCRITLRQPK
jgi:hypothetical protein